MVYRFDTLLGGTPKCQCDSFVEDMNAEIPVAHEAEV